MDDKIRTVLERLPEKRRSKLEQHEDLIRQLRRRGRTYEDIAHFFAEHLNLKVAPSTIHSFVRVRARRQHRLRIELPPVDNSSPALIMVTGAAVRRGVEEPKHRRPPEETERPVFHYDENEPLHLVRKTSEDPRHS